MLLYHFVIQTITNSNTFESVANKYLQFKWPRGNDDKIQTELKVGTPLYCQYDDQTIGYFGKWLSNEIKLLK